MPTTRMYSPSPSVRSSRVPLYLRGLDLGLGQDDGGDYVYSPDGTTAVDTTTGNVLDLTSGTLFDPSGSVIGSSAQVNAQSDLGPGWAISPDGTIAQNISTGDILDLSSGSLLNAGSTSAGITTGPLTPQESASQAVLKAGGTAAQAAKAAAAVNANSSNAQIATAVASALKSTAAITSSVAPKVVTPAVPASSLTSLLTKSSIISGVPDIAIYGIGLVGLLAVMGKR